MKIRNLFRIWTQLGLLLGMALGHTQSWAQFTGPRLDYLTIESKGGITYLIHTWTVGASFHFTNGPVSVIGTNVTLEFGLENKGGIIIGARDHTETHVSVLGILPPGNYLLCFETSAGSKWTENVLSMVSSFTAPITDEKTLRAAVETNQFNLAVAGITNVVYIVEASSNLANWTAVATNIGGPFTWKKVINPNTPQQFYRVKLEEGAPFIWKEIIGPGTPW